MKNKITAVKVIFEFNNNPEQLSIANFDIPSGKTFEMMFCNNSIPLGNRMKVYVATRRDSKLVLNEEEVNLL